MSVTPTLHDTSYTSAKIRLLSPFSKRYRNYLDLAKEPEDVRMLYEFLIMSQDKRLIHIKNSKVASTTIAQLMILYATGEARRGSSHRATKGLYLGRYYWKEIKPVLAARSAYHFAFVRDPYQRFFSGFKNLFVDRTNRATHKHIPPMTALGYDPKRDNDWNLEVFLAYIELCFETDLHRTNIHWRPQKINVLNDHVPLDFVGRLETFSTDIRHVFTAIGADDFVASDAIDAAFNQSKPRELTMSKAQKAKIETLYAMDFEAFGY